MTTDTRIDDAMRQLRQERAERDRRHKRDAAFKAVLTVVAIVALAWAIDTSYALNLPECPQDAPTAP